MPDFTLFQRKVRQAKQLGARLLAPTFPKAAFVAASLCAFILVEFRTPAPTVAARTKRPKVVTPLQVQPIILRDSERVALTPAAPTYTVPAIPTPLVSQTVPAPSKKVAKRVARKRRARRLAKRIKVERLAPEVMIEAAIKAEDALARFEAEFVSVQDNEVHAVNVTSPLETLSAVAFNEPAQTEEMQTNPVHVLTQDEIDAVAERRIQLVVGEAEKNDFTPIKTSLAAQAAEFASLSKPEPELVVPVAQKTKEVVVVPVAVKGEPELVRPQAKQDKLAKAEAKAVEAKDTTPELIKAVIAAKAETEEEIDEPPTREPAVLEAETEVAVSETSEPTLVRPSAVKKVEAAPVRPAGNNLFASLGSVGAALDTQMFADSVANQLVAPKPKVTTVTPVPERAVTHADSNVLVTPSPQSTTAKLAATETRLAVRKPSVDRSPQLVDTKDSDAEISQRVFTRLEIDADVEEWLDRKQGLVELSLRPVGDNDSQDMVFPDCPESVLECTIEPQGLRGRYQLVAKIFLPKIADAVATVVDTKVISAQTNTELVPFRIKSEAVRQALRAVPRGSASGVVFTANLYKVDPAKYRRNKPGKLNDISAGEITIVGYPEWGQAKLDEDGSFRLPLPARSELLAKVIAPGFYPSYRIIPTFASAVHQRIYLVDENVTDPIIGYFTGRSQIKENEAARKANPARALFGIVMGRLFDPISHAPVADALVDISYPTGAAQMLPATTESGFFGFSHVAAPSMRVVERPGGGPSFLVNVLEGSAQYFEPGRGGKRNVAGQLTGEHGPIAGARVRLAGNKRGTWESATNDQGDFQIDNVDLPAGLLTLEVQVAGHPLAWFNFPWDPRERERKLALRILPSDLLTERIKTNSDFRGIEKKRGMIVGRVRPQLYKNGNTCVSLALLDVQGRPLPAEHGPFPFCGISKHRQQCVTAAEPDFAFFNLKDGEYLLKPTNSANRVLRPRVLRVGTDRVTFTNQ